VKQQVWDGVKPIIEEWTGKKLEATSLYGIRVYRDKAILATHVDRLPLVSSCIINVDQDTNEPWPIEVYDHQGRAYNVTMEPGDMVLYESHTVLHGRPFPMNGSHYANVFVHFQPIDHEEVQSHDRELRAAAAAANAKSSIFSNPFASSPGSKKTKKETVTSHLKKAKIGGHEQDQHDEESIQKHLDIIDSEAALAAVGKVVSGAKRVASKMLAPNSAAAGEEAEEVAGEEEMSNEKQFAFDEKVFSKEELLRRTAARGDLDGLVKLLGGHLTNGLLLHSRDENGWQAIHEAVRSGSLDCVKYLVEMGADVGSKVEGGGAALWVARNTLGDEDGPEHEVTTYLVSIGAPEYDEPQQEGEEEGVGKITKQRPSK